MAAHLLKITTIVASISLCMFLPYIPGDYDHLAPTLAFMAQLLCFAALILVPIGIAWLIYEIIKYRKQAVRTSNTIFYFGVAASIALCIVVLFVVVTVSVSNNRFIGFITTILFAYFLLKFIPAIKKLKNTATQNFNPVPFYLICIPLLVLLIRFAFIERAVAYSRNIAIQKSEQLIRDIETYHQQNGHYPLSMLSVGKDYKTSVMGVKQYHYEPNGKAYNLYFEQIPGNISTKEIVMYNKLGQHEMTSHDQDLLLLSPGELNQQRGYFAVHDLPNLHWKYFWFD